MALAGIATAPSPAAEVHRRVRSLRAGAGGKTDGENQVHSPVAGSSVAPAAGGNESPVTKQRHLGSRLDERHAGMGAASPPHLHQRIVVRLFLEFDDSDLFNVEVRIPSFISIAGDNFHFSGDNFLS